MIVKHTKVEYVNKPSRFVLKRTKTGDKEILNRKHAVTNQLYSYERQRLEEDKGVFRNAPYQTHHVFNPRSKGWDYTELEEARSHADEYERVFLPFEQRNLTQWRELTWNKAETSFVKLANLGLQVIPYPIPKKGKLKDWLARKQAAQEKILPSQEIMPVLSSRHHEDTFQVIIGEEIRKSNFIGLHLYGLTDPIEAVNLSRLRSLNAGLKPNEVCALFVGYQAPRRLYGMDNVNSSFAYSTFGIDIFSTRQMSEAQIKAMLRNKDKLTEELWIYDPSEGRYMTNDDQLDVHGVGMIGELKNRLPVAEALNKYQAVIWSSIRNEQEDFNLLNGKLVERADIINYVRNERAGWCVFWEKYGSTVIG